MFRNPANGLIRIALFPVLLLFFQQEFGTRLPLLGPVFVAVFLTVSPVAPPVSMVLMMGAVLFATAWIQATLSVLLIDQPLVYYLILYVLMVWCMQRTRENPKDILSLLMLVSTAMVAVFTQQKGIDVSQLPLSLLLEILYAGLTTYLAYFLFPGGSPIAPMPKPPDSEPLHTELWHLALKGGVIVAVLWGSIRLDLVQSTVIVITVANIIKDPNPMVGRDYGVFRLLGTYAGFLFALPVLMMAGLQTNLFGQMGMAMVCAMLMGIFAMKKGASFNSLQVLYTGFIVLLYYGLTQTAGSAFVADGKRLVSIMLAVLLGIMVLIILQPADARTSLKRQQPKE